MSGNVKLALSHVVPDLVVKVLKGQDPLHILGDGARSATTRTAAISPVASAWRWSPDAAINEDFNLSTAQSRRRCWSSRELIWHKIHGDGPLHIVIDEPFEHDVQKRVPDVRKAKRVLGFEATTSLAQMLDEVIPWIARARGGAAVTLDSGDLDSVYRARFGDGEADGKLDLWAPITEYLARWIPIDGAVLDVACDRGYFIRNVAARERWATDIRDLSAAFDAAVRFRTGRRPCAHDIAAVQLLRRCVHEQLPRAPPVVGSRAAPVSGSAYGAEAWRATHRVAAEHPVRRQRVLGRSRPSGRPYRQEPR